MKIIAYQGEPGAYSEAAAKHFFGNDISLSPSFTFEIVFNKVKTGSADYGVVPVENSLYGSVFETYDHLRNFSVRIIGELYLQINHYLMAIKKYKPEELKKIYSHPQALGQCSQIIKTFKYAEITPVYDTAGAAKILAEQKEEYAAAIASKLAADQYGLKIIKGNIQNNAENYTRFVVISRKRTELQLPSEGVKTSLCFELQSMPGSLFRALSVFALRDIDLTKIESRPIPHKTFQYIFYIDLIGNLSDTKVKNAIKHLREISKHVQIFGSFKTGITYKS